MRFCSTLVSGFVFTLEALANHVVHSHGTHARSCSPAGPSQCVVSCSCLLLKGDPDTLTAMQAGGCYVPLDPSAPPERLAFMLKDSGARVLLTHNGLDAKVPESATPEVRTPKSHAQAHASLL